MHLQHSDVFGHHLNEESITDKVLFIEQNLFETDFSEATVLTLYLLPSVNLALRPKIFSECKPGLRIVSHDFDMGDWEPDQSSEIHDDNYDTIYYWILPANVSGTWEWSVSPADEKREYL